MEDSIRDILSSWRDWVTFPDGAEQPVAIHPIDVKDLTKQIMEVVNNVRHS